MAVKKFSEIALSGSPLDAADHLVGVRADNTDLLYSLEQVTRDRLTADRGYYVDNTTGSNSNPGTALLPFATLQYAWDHLSGTLDLGQSALNINVLNSATPYLLDTPNSFIGGSRINIVGESIASTQIDISLDLVAQSAEITLDKFTTVDFGISLTGNSKYYIGINDGISFTNASSIRLFRRPICTIGADLSIDATERENFILCSGPGTILDDFSFTATIVGTPNFTGAFVQCYDLALCNLDFIISGSATGKRFEVLSNAVINVGGDPDFFPGDIDGTIESGGQYIGIISERILLRADADYYVDNTTGSNSNDGSIGSPFATLQYAWDNLSGTLDLGQSALTINLVASGTPYLLAGISPFFGGTAVNILGAGSATTTADSLSFANNMSASVAVDGMTLIADSEGFCIDSVLPGSKLLLSVLSDIIVDNSAAFNFDIACEGGSFNTYDYVIAGGAGTVHLFCNNPGSNLSPRGVVTSSGSLSYDIFAQAAALGILADDGADYSGVTSTGQRFSVSSNAVIDVGGDPDFFPGDVAGTIESGGQYIGIVSERILLRADADYYVDNTTGSNSNDGSVGSPFATLQYAWDHLSGTLDLGQSNLTINLVASATPYTLIAQTSWIGGAHVHIVGAGSATTTINDVDFGSRNFTTINVDNVTLKASVAFIQALGVSNNSFVDVGELSDIVYDISVDLSCIAVSVGFGGTVINLSPTFVCGASQNYIYVVGGTASSCSEFGVSTITGTPAFIFGYAIVGNMVVGPQQPGGVFNSTFVSFAGTATGPRFDVESNGTINVNFGSDTTGTALPGSTAGTMVQGGRYLGLEAIAVADLPTGVPVGERQVVNDALLPAFGSPVANGGAVVVGVIWDGANWNVG